MANYVHVFFGPYLRIKRNYKDGEVFQRSCLKVECQNHKREFHDGGTQFCPLCGSKIDKVSKIKRVETVILHHLQDELNEAFAECYPSDKLRDLYAYIVPNHSRNQPRKFDLSVEYDSYILDDIDREVETAWLVKEFAEEINVYREKCGPENVEIKWGLFTYSN
jgi:hypothetical protein